MADFLFYDLKVAALLVVFYLFWKLLAARETFHRLNRVVLLSTMVLSLVLPLCVFTLHKTVELSDPPLPKTVPALINELESPEVHQPHSKDFQMSKGIDWRGILDGPSGGVLFLLYLSGTLFCLARTLYSIYSVRRLYHRCELHEAPQLTQLAGGKVVVAVTEDDVSPFSWMRTIILNRADFAEGNPALLAHECGHIRNHHSVDVIIVDVLTALQWFNPVIWFLRQDLRTIHEYEADAAVVSQGFNRYQYLQLLIRKAAGCGGYSIANGINDSTLKKRITMMLKNKTPKHGWMRLLYVVPVIALSLAATAKTVVEYTIKYNSSTVTLDNEAFISFSPTLVNRAHPQTGGAYVISIPKDIQQKNKEELQVIAQKTGNSALDMFMNEENGHYKVAYYKATTTMMLNGKEFDERSLPNLKADDVLMVEGSSQANGKSTLNFITNPYKLSDADFRRWVHRQRLAGVSDGDLMQKLLNIGPVPRKHILMANDEYRNAKYNGKNEVDEVAGEEPIFNTPENLAQFPGGTEKLMEFMMRNLKYPKEAINLGMTGRVIVQFVVEKDGTLTNLKVVKSIEPKSDDKMENKTQQDSSGQAADIVINSYKNEDLADNKEEVASPSKLLDEEALRVVRLMPKWIPAKQQGKVVRSRFAVPVIFRLN